MAARGPSGSPRASSEPPTQTALSPASTPVPEVFEIKTPLKTAAAEAEEMYQASIASMETMLKELKEENRVLKDRLDGKG